MKSLKSLEEFVARRLRLGADSDATDWAHGESPSSDSSLVVGDGFLSTSESKVTPHLVERIADEFGPTLGWDKLGGMSYVSPRDGYFPSDTNKSVLTNAEDVFGSYCATGHSATYMAYSLAACYAVLGLRRSIELGRSDAGKVQKLILLQPAFQMQPRFVKASQGLTLRLFPFEEIQYTSFYPDRLDDVRYLLNAGIKICLVFWSGDRIIDLSTRTILQWPRDVSLFRVRLKFDKPSADKYWGKHFLYHCYMPTRTRTFTQIARALAS